ncbi:MAG: flagellar biosynthesis anti-sigma factor FlgM [Sandaracinaceae bacterium]
MKISGQPHLHRVDGPRGQSRAKGSDEAPPCVREEASQVHMSDAAVAMRHARAPEQPSTEKIERLKAAIERGDFKVDAEAIASRMMEEES